LCGGTIQPPPEKCTLMACANEPKPPRVTVPELELDGEVPDADLFDEESPLNNPQRDDPPPAWPPLEEDPRGEHPALDGAAMPGWPGAQFSLGISA
jgi:hypothetical protein